MRKIKNFIHLLDAYYWAWKCGWPGKKLYMIGITGTDGKTTTTTLIYEILKAAGIKVDYVTTVNSEGLHTTNPSPKFLQPLLKRMVDTGVTHCVLEVTSHGLDQNRVAGIDFKIGVLTNITHEHLDYHGTMANYVKAKEKLFRKVKYAVLPNFKFLIFNFQTNPNAQIINYQKTRIKNISESLLGEYNSYNVSAAAEVAKILKIEKFVAPVVRSFSGVLGRREEVKNKLGIKVYVDFAHTPNALEQVLKSLRQVQGKNKLIVVFGCTGERDKTKRPMMGEIVARLADIVIITSDDTRSEDQNEIAKEILAGIKNKESVLVINDRYQAIKKALGMARKNDIVLVAGKGHEKTILLGTTEYPWNDADVVRKICKKQKSNLDY